MEPVHPGSHESREGCRHRPRGRNDGDGCAREEGAFQAIAEGLGPEARALSTAEASGAAIANADLVVAGAPVLAFILPTDKLRESLGANPGRAPAPPDLSHPSMHSWLKALPKGRGRSAAFETRIRGPWGRSTSGIARGLEHAGYTPLAEPCSFMVTGTYGPLQDGELQRRGYGELSWRRR